MQNEIQLRLTIDQVNLILQALGEQPFKEVFEIVNTIQAQASVQLNARPAEQQPAATPPSSQDA